MRFDLEENNKYGILLSGGLDSAVLLYLLVRSNSSINLQPFTIPKKDGSAVYAAMVVNHVNNKFNLAIPAPILVGNPDAHHTKQSTSAIVEIFHKYKVDYLYMGVNSNPPELDSVEGAPKRFLNSPNPKLVYPFAHLIKDQVLKIMFDEDQSDLANVTHSCTEQRVGRCNQCWQCKERAWAFNKLHKTDTGTL